MTRRQLTRPAALLATLAISAAFGYFALRGIRFGAFSVRAPEERGDYRFVVTLVQEQVAWFDDLDELNAWSGRVQVA